MKETKMTSELNSKYQRDVPFDKRKEEVSNIRKKYPDRVPVIVEKHPHSRLPDLEMTKYLVPNDLTVGQLMWLIRRRMKLSCDQAFFVFVSSKIPSSSTTLSEIYDECKDDDGFLYMTYSGENTYGYSRLKPSTSLCR